MPIIEVVTSPVFPTLPGVVVIVQAMLTEMTMRKLSLISLVEPPPRYVMVVPQCTVAIPMPEAAIFVHPPWHMLRPNRHVGMAGAIMPGNWVVARPGMGAGAAGNQEQ